MKTCAVIVAAGKSTRFGGSVPKQFAELAGRPVLAWTVQQFEDARSINEIVLVVAEEFLEQTSEVVVDAYEFRKVRRIVSGGDSRRQSVLNGLERLAEATELVAIHDGARPLVRPSDIDE
ncbi:NTP transferase domain-containing protein, partial [candidate division GN15 bacterium]|nr:NTP transferase domain-containing protein [candidate division GN15 bacterium]